VLTRVFFATDIHGSDKCWIKFLNAGDYYEADVIILGGDMTGKGIVPIVEQSDGTYKATFLDHKEILNSVPEVEQLEKKIRATGLYPYRTSKKEMEEFEANPAKVDELFNTLMFQSVEKWMKIADERLNGKKIKCFVCPGNDDRPEIDRIIQGSQTVALSAEKIVTVDDHHEMISLGWSNPTPWHTFRECSEEEIGKKIVDLASQVRDMENSIFNLHVPPFKSKLDEAPELDETLKPKYAGQSTVPVGSVAVRESIERNQPLLGLHGHIHEGNGDCKIGRTLCLNPGSSYGQGVLMGYIINLDEKRVKSFFSTSG
jgi:hypothetical protein